MNNRSKYFGLFAEAVSHTVGLIVVITEPMNRHYQEWTSSGRNPGTSDGTLACRLSALFLSVSNWFLINNCNQSQAFTPTRPLTVGANLKACEYFWAHSPHAASYHKPRPLSTNHMKGHECRMVTIRKKEEKKTTYPDSDLTVSVF